MIKKIGMILIMLCLVGCNSAENENQKLEQTEVTKSVQKEEKKSVENEDTTIVYSFTGASEDFSLYNGVIVLSSEQQSLYGGELHNNQENLSDVLSYTVDYFILSDERKESLFTIETGDLAENDNMLTRERLMLSGVTSKDIFKTDSHDNIKNNFYVEVTANKTNGDKESYTIKLDATKVGVNLNHN